MSLVHIPSADEQELFLLSRVDADQNLIPIELFGTNRLFLQQVIRVVDDEPGPGALETGKRCQTVSYRYRLEEPDRTPLIRWEYDREPPRENYPYPRAHVHVHARFSDDEDIERLHISTDRVALELVLWHLLTEDYWGVESKVDDWVEVFQPSIDGFIERRTFP